MRRLHNIRAEQNIDRVFQETLQKQESKTRIRWKEVQIVIVLRVGLDGLP